MWPSYIWTSQNTDGHTSPHAPHKGCTSCPAAQQRTPFPQESFAAPVATHALQRFHGRRRWAAGPHSAPAPCSGRSRLPEKTLPGSSRARCRARCKRRILSAPSPGTQPPPPPLPRPAPHAARTPGSATRPAPSLVRHRSPSPHSVSIQSPAPALTETSATHTQLAGRRDLRAPPSERNPADLAPRVPA
jgi:hypothetical protein